MVAAPTSVVSVKIKNHHTVGSALSPLIPVSTVYHTAGKGCLSDDPKIITAPGTRLTTLHPTHSVMPHATADCPCSEVLSVAVVSVRPTVVSASALARAWPYSRVESSRVIESDSCAPF